SHQSPAGEWDFVQKQMEPVNRILGETEIPSHPCRFVIVDTCYASALRGATAWDRAWKSPTLFAAAASEETQELDFHNPQPVDMSRRYPLASAWLNEHLGSKWNGKLSFLGFVWVQTFLTSNLKPIDRKSWIEFLRHCEPVAEEFRRNASRRLASMVTLKIPNAGIYRGDESPQR
ncbi:MAG: hypothetical protein ABL994_17725, partial [Verrucomicrobiales bacterium]